MTSLERGREKQREREQRNVAAGKQNGDNEQTKNMLKLPGNDDICQY